MSDLIDPEMRRAAVAMIARGEASPAEVADAWGISRQIVHYWIKAAGIDWKRQRRTWLLKRLTRERDSGPRLAERPNPKRKPHREDG